MLTKKQKENFLICEKYFKLTDFEMSIRKGDFGLFNSYLQEIPNIDVCHLTSENESLINLSLKQASFIKDYTIPITILNHKSFDITKEHNDPLKMACLLNDFSIFKFLISKGFSFIDNEDNYLNILLSNGIIKENLSPDFLNIAFYLISRYKKINGKSLLLFHVILLKQHIKRSKSLYSEKYFNYLINKSDALFIQIVKKGGYNKNTTILNQNYEKNIIIRLVEENEYKLLSYILKDSPKDIYYYIKNQECYPLFYAIKEKDIFLFEWLLSNTDVKDTKNDDTILTLSYIINVIEDNHDKKLVKQIYDKKNDILENMFNSLIYRKFSCHLSFRELSSAYSLLLLTEKINKDLKFRLLEKIKESIDFEINRIDSSKETVFSIIYTNNDYVSLFKWLIGNGASINFNNISSLNRIIAKDYDFDKISSILNIDDPEEYYKTNGETIYHSLIQLKHSSDNMFNLLNLFYKYNYDILSLDYNDKNCISFSKDKELDCNFLNCLYSFYQKENIKTKMKEKEYVKTTKNITVKRI